MATLAKRHMDRTRHGQDKFRHAIDPVPSTRKRPRPGTDADNDGKTEDGHEAPSKQRKRPKLHTESQELRRLEVQEILPPLFRRSPRLRNLRESKGQLSSREQRRTERSSAAALHQGQKGARPRKEASARSDKVKRQGYSKQGKTQGSPVKSSTARRGKRQRNAVSGNELSRAIKRQRPLSVGQADSIDRWLDESYPYQEPPIVGKLQALEATVAMPRKSVAILPSPEDSSDRITTSSRKSERTTASVHDTDYHESLSYRNIYIEREDPPPELIKRASRMITRERASPEMDDVTVEKLTRKSRRIRNEAEDIIVKQLAHHLIPGIDEVPDRRLEMNADQPWSNSVPILLDPSLLTNPLPLPKPKPDLAFGYSQAAFTRNQLGTIKLLVDDEFGRSYAQPDQKLRFPFLCIEIKSQAKNGTHYVATNQAAGAGAIALRGTMDLVERSSGLKTFDYEEPHFFSVTMDHQLACVNVHWLRAPVDGGMHSFHVEGLSQHLLKDADGIRAITRAIKNILDYGTDQRLRTLCEALDAYRAIVVRNREAADPHRARHEAQVKGARRSTPVPRQASADELTTEPQKTKKSRHGPKPAENIGLGIPTAATTSTARHTAGVARKSVYNVAPKASPSRHTAVGGAVGPKRQIKPSQKMLESTKHISDGRSRHEP